MISQVGCWTTFCVLPLQMCNRVKNPWAWSKVPKWAIYRRRQRAVRDRTMRLRLILYGSRMLLSAFTLKVTLQMPIPRYWPLRKSSLLRHIIQRDRFVRIIENGSKLNSSTWKGWLMQSTAELLFKDHTLTGREDVKSNRFELRPFWFGMEHTMSGCFSNCPINPISILYHDHGVSGTSKQARMV